MQREFVHPSDCQCYKCTGSDIAYTDDGHRYVENNMEHHTIGQVCQRCGKPRSEYRDLGRKGRYVCWWCTKRAAGPPRAET